MGCDIHSFAEVRKDGVWELVEDAIFPYDEFDREWLKKDFSSEPIRDRNYGLFGWLADVRNYSMVTPICEPKGLPRDVSDCVSLESYDWEPDGHSHSWLSLKELLEVDYDVTFEDRRVTRGSNGAYIADVGEGTIVSLRDHLGNEFFSTLEVLKTLGSPEDVRLVFWFDN